MRLHITVLLCTLVTSFCFASNSTEAVVDQWRTFMRYRLIRGHYQSPVAGADFFMTPQGAKDSDGELKKTIEIFSQRLPSADQHPQCLFPARYSILRKGFRLAEPVACPNFDNWLREYSMTSVNVMYGSQYISNPTSAFGHSFFLLDSNRTLEYLRVTYNYGADIPAGVGARLIIDGLGGGFSGNYSIVPLYHRLHSYNDIENRDIWEYSLALSIDERDLLVKSLWESRDKLSAPYFFLTGNCASEILEMINVVRPDLKLKTSSPLYSSPQEIFRVLDKNKLIASVKYRPSLEKQLDDKLSKLTAAQRNEFRESLKPEIDFPHDILIAETALAYVQLLRQKNAGETPEELISLERRALLARSKMPELPAVKISQESWPPAPHEAQGPNLIAIGRGSEDSVANTNIVFRPAFHDLMQTDAGFLNNSSIDILALEASWPDQRDPHLESLTLGRIVNFREVKMYDPLAMSWAVGAKFIRNKFFHDSLRYHFIASPEFGLATKWTFSPLTFFLLMATDIREGSVAPLGRFGWGPHLGAIGTFGRWKAYLSAKVSWQSGEAQTWQQRESDFKIRYNLNREWDVLAEYHREDTARNEESVESTLASIRYSF